jgi:uncharacterized lipoprotein NlpE involved in copper resistance
MNKQIFSTSLIKVVCTLFMVNTIACGETTENNKASEVEISELVPGPVDEHTTQNSVDYAGTYKGITPCADCEGIEIELTINMDSTYSHSSNYLGKGDGKAIVKTGKYVWIDGGTIELDGMTDGPSKFKVGEGRIWQLDMEGNKIEGDLADKYILTKI